MKKKFYFLLLIMGVSIFTTLGVLQTTPSTQNFLHDKQISPSSPSMSVMASSDGIFPIIAEMQEFFLFVVDPIKILQSMKTFYFTFSSKTLLYDIVIGAMYINGMNPLKSILVIEIFVNSLNNLYVTNQDMTFTYNLTGSCQGIDFNVSGAVSDDSGGGLLPSRNDPFLCSFSILNLSTVRLLPGLFSISLEYNLNAPGEFDVDGTFTSSGISPAMPSTDFYFFIFLIILATTLILLRKKIVKLARKIRGKDDSYSKFAKRPYYEP